MSACIEEIVGGAILFLDRFQGIAIAEKNLQTQLANGGVHIIAHGLGEIEQVVGGVLLDVGQRVGIGREIVGVVAWRAGVGGVVVGVARQADLLQVALEFVA